MPEKLQYKSVEHEGRKYFELTGSKVMAIADYGRSIIKGSDVSREANLNIGFEIDNEKEYVMLKGFLNNKFIPGTDEPAKDSYGDVPTGDNVYDIQRLKNNPIALCNHNNDASMIAGNFIYLQETAQGLQFKEILRPIDEIFEDCTKDVVSAWAKGWGKAYSIGGRWLYDAEKSRPEDNYYVLVKAILHEASHVAIGADQWALSAAPDTTGIVQKGKEAPSLTPDEAITKFIETKDVKFLELAKAVQKGN